MTLDLPTLYAIAALALTVAGAVQLLPWLTGRADRAAMWWASGLLMMGGANIAVLVRGHPPVVLFDYMPNVAHVLAYGFILHGIRTFERPDAPFRPVGIAIVLCLVPVLVADVGDYAFRNGYMNLIRGGWDLAVAIVAIRLARHQGLHTAWTTAVLFGAAVPLFFGRAWLAWTGQLGKEVFGPQHGPAIWLAAAAISLVIFRGFSLPQMLAESTRNALVEQATRDPLTGAYNRSKLDALARTLTGPVAVMMIDLDRFKHLNDVHGHAIGDAALRLVATAARTVVDTGGWVLRMGGDEFLCIMPSTTFGEAQTIGERISERIARGMPAVGADLPHPTLSIGIALGEAGHGIANIMIEADHAMYRIKATRRSRRSDTRPDSAAAAAA